MDKEENLVVIKEVNAETFDDFLGLIDKLAEYEKLSPPDEEAKRRLRRDCFSEKPKYKAFIGKVGDKSCFIRHFFLYLFKFSCIADSIS